MTHKVWHWLTWIERIEPSTTRNGLKGAFVQFMTLVFFTTPVGGGRDTLFDFARGLMCYAIPWSCPYSASADEGGGDKSMRTVHYLTFYPGAKAGKQKMWSCHDDIALPKWRDKRDVVMHTMSSYVASGDDGIADNSWFRLKWVWSGNGHCSVAVMTKPPVLHADTKGFYWGDYHSEDIPCESPQRRHCAYSHMTECAEGQAECLTTEDFPTDYRHTR